MPTIRTIRVMATETLEVEWIAIKQVPGVSPAEFEQESLVERYKAPPRTVWEARARKLGEEGEKEERGKEPWREP